MTPFRIAEFVRILVYIMLVNPNACFSCSPNFTPPVRQLFIRFHLLQSHTRCPNSFSPKRGAVYLVSFGFRKGINNEILFSFYFIVTCAKTLKKKKTRTPWRNILTERPNSKFTIIVCKTKKKAPIFKSTIASFFGLRKANGHFQFA